MPDATPSRCQPPEKEKSRPCRRRRARGRRAPGVDTLPDDVLSAIFSRVPSGDAGVARCAAACRRWGRVVAERAAAIARALRPARFLPHLALGVLHGPQFRGTRTRRKPVAAASASGQPQFLSVASGGSPSLRLDGGLFDSARPVASRNGRIVLELRREGRTDGLTLCVCNPMAGPDDAAVLPPLAGDDCPGYYACTILTGDDLVAPRCSPGLLFFRVLLVYNRRSFTALRCYSSDAGTWGPEHRKPGAKMSGTMLRQLGPAVVLRGVAYWPTHRAAFGVRLGGTLDVCWVPYIPHFLPDFRLLGVSPDGERLSYISATRTLRRYLIINVDTLQLQGIEDMSTLAHRWDRNEGIRLPQFEVPGATALKLRWFGEKSGTLFFTIGEGGNTSGAFALNLATRSVQKLADGVECNSWTNVCGYEMDRATLLASVAARFD